MLSPPRTEWETTDTGWKPRQIGRPPEPEWSSGGMAWLVKIALGALALAVVVPFLVVLALWVDYHSLLSGKLPAEKPSVVSGLTRVYDDAGNQIALLRQFDLSIPVQEQDIPQDLKQAVVAAEDRRFYSHGAVDDRAILRAIWADVTKGTFAEGASTITQQYVRLVYLDNAKTLHRKLQEAALARRVEKDMSKDEILYRYLDRVYLGDGAYGVGAAAQSYFHKSVHDLTLSESALLAGLIRLPSVNEPRGNPSGAEAVRRLVLDEMLAQHRISQAAHDDAMAQTIQVLDDGQAPPDGPATVIFPQQSQQTQYPYFVDYVRRYLIAKYGDEAVYKGGLQVHTTLNPSLQAKAEKAIGDTLNGTSPPLDMALVSVDPRTGYVRALVGGRDFSQSQVNLALGHCDNPTPPKDGEPFCIDGGGSGRQAGSSFKPFTLAKALEKGFSVSRVYRAPYVYTIPNCTGDGCTIHNAEGEGGGSMTIRQATAYSVNTVYAQLILDVGIKDVAELANRLGVTMVNPDGKLPSGEPYGPGLTLGVQEVSPLDMAGAYSVFANRGVQMSPVPVTDVETHDGKVLEDNRKRPGKRVLSQDIADQVNDVLTDVVQYGTGYGADFGHPNGIAGKTGTAENYSDAWYDGYTPELATSIWMGYSDSQKPLVNIKGQAQVYGATFGVPTWRAYMEAAAPELGLTDFAKPAPPTTLPSAPVAPSDAAVTAPTTPTTLPQYVFPTIPRPTTPPPTQFPLPSPTSIYRPPPPTYYVPPTTTYTPPTTRYSPPTTRNPFAFPP